MKRGFWKVPATIAAFGMALAMVLTGCSTDSKTDPAAQRGSATMLESAHPNNDFGTTAIVLEFDGSVIGLIRENIVVFQGTGEVETRGLTGGGSRWELGVTVLRYGVVSVKIDRDGIAAETHEVTVHPVDWTAEWYSPAADEDAIRFIFRTPIDELGLDAANIELYTPVGDVVRGELSRIDGRQWSLGVSLDGEVSFLLAEIYRHGISPFGNADATSSYHIPISANTLKSAVINMSPTTGNKTLVLTFEKPVLNLVPGNIIVTPGTGTFALGSPLTASSDGTVWTVPVTTNDPGATASVSIDRTGVSKTPVDVVIPGVTLVAARICGHEVEGQKSLVLTFSNPLSSLTSAEVEIWEGTGDFRMDTDGTAPRAFTTSDTGLDEEFISEPVKFGTIWTIPITVLRSGLAAVSVDKPGVLSGRMEVVLPSLATIAEARYIPGDKEKWIEFELSYPVPNLTRENIIIVGETGELTPATGDDSLQGTHPWKSWRVKIDSIQREGTALISIEKAGVSDAPARVHVQQILVTSVRIVNNWGMVGRSAVAPPSMGSLGVEITLSAPVLDAPGIHFLSDSTSNTLVVNPDGIVVGSGTTWVLPLSVTNSTALPPGNWGSGRLNNVTVTGQPAPPGELANIRTVTIPRVWGLVGPGAPSGWACPEHEPTINGWSLDDL